MLVDEKMTDGRGIELLEGLSENIIVIMILAEDTELSEGGLHKYGVADFIKKPFNPIVLKAKVGTQLQKKKLSCKVGSSACFDALGVAFPEFMSLILTIENINIKSEKLCLATWSNAC